MDTTATSGLSDDFAEEMEGDEWEAKQRILYEKEQAIRATLEQRFVYDYDAYPDEIIEQVRQALVPFGLDLIALPRDNDSVEIPYIIRMKNYRKNG